MSRPEARVLETTVGPRTLIDIEDALERTWVLHPGVPETVRMQMGIAAGEIGANIIEHAALGQPVRLCMDVRVLPGQVHIEFTDEGRPLALDLSTVSLPDDLSERGRGLALAQRVLGTLSYQRSEINHWTLVSKRFA